MINHSHFEFFFFLSGDTVFIQGAAATPTKLVSALAQYGKSANLNNVQVCAMHTEGAAEYTDPSLENVFRSVSFFMGGNVRKAVADGRADAVPIFLHEIPKLFHQKIYRPDVAFISVFAALFHSISIALLIDSNLISFQLGITTRSTRLLFVRDECRLRSSCITAFQMHCW